MKKKKVLYIITKSNHGGAQVYVRDVVVHLPSSFTPVVALSGNGWLKHELENRGIRTIEIKTFQRDINLYKDVCALFDIYKIVKVERPDILHVNSSKAGGLGTFVGRLLGVPRIVFTAHGWAFNEKRNIFSRCAIFFFVWLTVLYSHKTITVSSALKKQIARFPFISKKLVLIHNGIAPTAPIPREDARIALKQMSSELDQHVQQNDIWIGTIAELHKNKGLEYMIESVRILVNEGHGIKLIIIGEGDERKRLKKYIADSALEKHVFLIGHVSSAARYLRALDMFALSSQTEASGYVLLEAGLAALPVVATGVGGIPEIVEDMQSGIVVKPRQPSEIAKALLYLMEHKQKQEQFGNALSARVRQQFSIESMIADTLNVYSAS